MLQLHCHPTAFTDVSVAVRMQGSQFRTKPPKAVLPCIILHAAQQDAICVLNLLSHWHTWLQILL